MNIIKKNKRGGFSLIKISIVILIIGILIAGAAQGSRLMGQFKLNTAEIRLNGGNALNSTTTET